MSDYSVELSGMQMMQFIHGYIPSQAIYVAAKLGLADLIGDVPRPVEESWRMRRKLTLRRFAVYSGRWLASAFLLRTRMEISATLLLA
jgi:hypothetical protein